MSRVVIDIVNRHTTCHRTQFITAEQLLIHVDIDT